MVSPSGFAVPLAVLDEVKVPRDEQVLEQDVHVDHTYVAAEDLDRARLLSISESGRLRLT